MPTDPEREYDDAALARYFAGESDEREEIAIRRWIGADPERAEEIARLHEVWEASAGEQPDVDAALARVLGRGERAGSVKKIAARRAAIWGARNPLVKWVAAAALVLAIGSLGVWRFVMRGDDEMRVRELATAPGARTTMTLADGTRLVLGPATKLRVPKAFGRGERVVELDGEALFTVVHDASRPFVVRTASVDVRDVGTTFAVEAYRDDRSAHVAVERGVVAIGGAELQARDAAAVDSVGRVTVQRGVDVSRYLGWAQGNLVFEDTPLRQAARELARTYDLKITIADSLLAGKLVTASFSDEPVDAVLDAVTRVVGGRYERSGRDVVIHRGVAPVGRPVRGAASEERMARVGAGS